MQFVVIWCALQCVPLFFILVHFVVVWCNLSVGGARAVLGLLVTKSTPNNQNSAQNTRILFFFVWVTLIDINSDPNNCNI